MKKFLSITILTVVILLSFGFVILKAGSLGSSENYFNRNWRQKFASSYFWREALGLHFDGDASSDYLGTKYSSILIEIDAMDQTKMPTSVMDRFADKVKDITGKSVKYLYSDENLTYKQSLSMDEVEQTVKSQKNYNNQGDTASLYILSASLNEENPDLIGSTIDESGIVIFESSLYDFTKHNPELYNSYLYSTLLHEFGHQLGLGHNSEFDCLMNEEAEERNVFFENPDEVIVDFCPYEQEELQRIKSQL